MQVRIGKLLQHKIDQNFVDVNLMLTSMIWHQIPAQDSCGRERVMP